SSGPSLRLHVLNAFRHHRNSHLCQSTYQHPRLIVLNAFRHHRNSHLFRLCVRHKRHFVLNAFRHHRNSHRILQHCQQRLFLCSTPFGIIGILTSEHCHLLQPHLCA